jgi:hypothetical protein
MGVYLIGMHLLGVIYGRASHGDTLYRCQTFLVGLMNLSILSR